jgi:VIT1/CCC1 family predicted Fe2+/Mn2+ transporter
MAETVTCAECSKAISRSDAVAGVSAGGWICLTCFSERAQIEEDVVRRVKRRGLVLAVVGFALFLLGVVLVVATTLPIAAGTWSRAPSSGYVMVTGVAVAGLAMALTGVMKARRKSKYEGIVPGA